MDYFTYSAEFTEIKKSSTSVAYHPTEPSLPTRVTHCPPKSHFIHQRHIFYSLDKFLFIFLLSRISSVRFFFCRKIPSYTNYLSSVFSSFCKNFSLLSFVIVLLLEVILFYFSIFYLSTYAFRTSSSYPYFLYKLFVGYFFYSPFSSNLGGSIFAYWKSEGNQWES